MIFSNLEREHYRKELEAASNAGDIKRVRRLIDQIRLLGEIRDTTPKMKGIEEYIKQQKVFPLPLKVFPPEALIDQAEMSFRDVLRSGFRDSGWTW